MTNWKFFEDVKINQTFTLFGSGYIYKKIAGGTSINITTGKIFAASPNLVVFIIN